MKALPCLQEYEITMKVAENSELKYYMGQASRWFTMNIFGARNCGNKRMLLMDDYMRTMHRHSNLSCVKSKLKNHNTECTAFSYHLNNFYRVFLKSEQKLGRASELYPTTAPGDRNITPFDLPQLSLSHESREPIADHMAFSHTAHQLQELVQF